MGGKVKVKSTVDVGTTFKISMCALCKLDESDVSKSFSSIDHINEKQTSNKTSYK